MKDFKVKAFILAAGLGTRLKYITRHIPKPLIPIANRSMLEWVLENIHSADIHNIGINLCHHSELLEKFINSLPYNNEITIFREKKLLGTGGPLVNAATFVKNCDAILIHNSDIITNFSIGKLLKFHYENLAKYPHYLCSMMLIDGPENKVSVKTADGRNAIVTDISGKLKQKKNKCESPSHANEYAVEDCLLTYCGIMILSPKILNFLPIQPVYSSIIDAILLSLEKHPDSIGGYIAPANTTYWNDAGTFRRYINICKNIFSSNNSLIKSHPVFKKTDSKQICPEVIRLAEAGSHREFYRVNIYQAPYLANLLQERTDSAGALRNEQTSFRDENVNTAIAEKTIKYHNKNNKNTEKKISGAFVVMLSSQDDKDFFRYIQLGKYFADLSLQTPRIYDYNEQDFSVITEDLGDNSILQLVSNNSQKFSSEKKLERLYKKIIDELIFFQYKGTRALNNRPELLSAECAEFFSDNGDKRQYPLQTLKASENSVLRIFDYDYLRWETRYFTEEFLCNYCNLNSQQQISKLHSFFDYLARSVLNHPYILIHRDFQSSNILLYDNKIRFVDFQGARLGPFAYDIMSLLHDPYLFIPAKLQKDGLLYFIEKITASGVLSYGFNPLEDSSASNSAILLQYSYEAGLQRVMQALGAYAFLGIKKQKKHYLKYIPRALENLNDILSGYIQQFNKTEAIPLQKLINSKNIRRDVNQNSRI